VYLGISHASYLTRAEFQGSPILGVLLYSCPHPLTQNDQIRHGNTNGEGRVFRSATPCICTNASRGFSAIQLSFLVSARRYAYSAVLVVCPSVRPSVRHVGIFYPNSYTDSVILLSRPGSPIIRVS